VGADDGRLPPLLDLRRVRRGDDNEAGLVVLHRHRREVLRLRNVRCEGGSGMRNPDPSVMPVCDKVCDRCLLGSDPLVSDERVDEILTELATTGRAFICHKASMNGDYVVCRSFYEQGRSLSVRLARALDRVRFVKVAG
jgi:hypothetical protein